MKAQDIKYLSQHGLDIGLGQYAEIMRAKALSDYLGYQIEFEEWIKECDGIASQLTYEMGYLDGK